MAGFPAHWETSSRENLSSWVWAAIWMATLTHPRIKRQQASLFVPRSSLSGYFISVKQFVKVQGVEFEDHRSPLYVRFSHVLKRSHVRAKHVRQPLFETVRVHRGT